MQAHDSRGFFVLLCLAGLVPALLAPAPAPSSDKTLKDILDR